ncbi:hypothetical protein QJQ58_23005 [Paenibacillus dendritiformis]|uniref:hypothetical protein n=1 Tax=Paenibacillus dendritiformis TaxID=130049 RepID=UPI00248B091D|nr:hypothetical protein [Paenibacillus dendritiformis]WGU93377.1 hypothetical protein QJQ58_23005 [Paenibacillus dendritiformis]
MSYTIEFIKSLFPDSITAAIAIILIVLVFWMYKELRSNFLESYKSNQQRIDKALDTYSDLEFEMYKFFNERSDMFTVTEKISKATSILPFAFIQKLIKFKETTNEMSKKELLHEFHKEIQEEILSLKSKQLDSVTLKSDKDIFAVVDRYIKTKIAPFGVPFIHTYLNISFLMLLVLFVISLLSAKSFKEQIWIFSLVFASLFFLLVLYLIISEGFIKKRFKHSFTNWILFLMFAIGLPLAVIFTGAWFRGVIALVLIFIYSYYAAKKCMKESAV